MAPIDLGVIKVCHGQKFSWKLKLKRDGVVFPTAGCGVACQIRTGVQPEPPILVPSLDRDDSAGVFVFSVSEAQAKLLVSTATTFTNCSKYVIEIDFAYADAPIEFVMRFWASLEVYPGGLT